MTDDELDLLASAYLDGEATSEEVDIVERDPELLSRVETLRSISEQVAVPVTGPSAEVKEQHLAAAIAAFGLNLDAGADLSGNAAAPVIDLSEHARRPRSSTRSTTRTTSSRDRTMPRWLPAAAALLLFGGAGAIIASQGLGGDDNATEAAVMEAESGEDASDDSADFDDSADSAESTEAQAAESVMADDATEEMAGGMDEEFAGDEAMADNEAMEDGAEEEQEFDSDTAAESAPAPERTEGGFFPEDPVLFFDSVPDADQILRNAEPDLRVDVSQSQCGDFAAPLTDDSVLGYLPIEVAGEPAELFVLRENDTDSAVIFAVNGCQLVTP